MRTFVATTVKSKRWFSLESKTSGKRMPQLSKSEVREDMEGNHRAEDINPNTDHSLLVHFLSHSMNS